MTHKTQKNNNNDKNLFFLIADYQQYNTVLTYFINRFESCSRYSYSQAVTVTCGCLFFLIPSVPSLNIHMADRRATVRQGFSGFFSEGSSFHFLLMASIKIFHSSVFCALSSS